MGFHWSLNPYMGCAHRCTFCYVRAFELRADRPSDERYGRSIRVKVNVAEVLRRELARPSWQGETVAIGAATDPYQPAEGRYKLTRACLEALRDTSNPFSLITRSPMIVRDLDVLVDAAKRAEVGDRLLGPDPRRGRLAPDRAGDAAAAAPPGCGPATRRRRDRRGRRDGTDPARHLRPAGPARAGRSRRARGGRDEHLGQPPLPQARHARALPDGAGARLARGAASATSSSTGTAPTSRGSSASPSARSSRSCARSTESAIGARVKLRPEPPPSSSRCSRSSADSRRPFYDRAMEGAPRMRSPCLIVDDHEVVREGLAPLALPRTAHPGHRRGGRRRDRRRAGRAA